MDKDYLIIVFVGMILGFALIFSLLLPATQVVADECDTMLCGWCEEYPDECSLYPYPYPMPELQNEFLPVVANALLPTPAPTMNPLPTITYPPPRTPVP